MKTHLPMRSLQVREALAWLVLTVAVVLFATAFAFAQDSKKSSGKIHIRMEKEENGKTTRIDTTFDAADMEQAREFMEQLDGTPPPPPPGTPGVHRHRFHGFPFEEGDSEEFRAAMKHLEKEMAGLEKKLKEMHLEMYSDS